MALIINEIHADPAGDLTGDANGDGTRSATQDEFVEILNTGVASVDIGGFTLSDAIGVRHTFASGTSLAAGSAIVVFGGGTPTGSFGGAQTVTASSGTLGFNNTGDTVSLSDGATIIATYTYGSEGGNNQSLTRDPDETGSFVQHGSATGSGGALYSPGAQINGTPFGDPATPVINEFVLNHTGSDTFEFVEVLGAANTDYSGFYIVEIEGDGSSSGLVDGVFQLATSDADGYFTLPFQANQFENGTVTLLLVENFTGVVGDDIDTDNDGVIDAVFWDQIVDSIAVSDGGSGDQTYGGVTLLAGFDGGSFTVGGASRIPNGTDTDAPADWVRNDFDGAGIPALDPGSLQPGEARNTPGAANELAPLLADAFIHEVQGSGSASPLIGQSVRLEAVVTADFQDSADSDYNGFFIQEEDADADADPLTSEGIFVFEGGNSVNVNVGDLVEVTGTVNEFFGETQITLTSVSVLSSGNDALVTPTAVSFPVAGTTTNDDGHIIADLEAYEGMLVEVSTEMTVGDLFTLGRYGDVGLNAGGRIQNFTQTNAPDIAGYAQFQQDVAASTLILDDAFRGAQNRDPAFPPPGLNADTGNILRSGDTITGLTGVLAYREPGSEGASHRLIATETPEFTASNPRVEEAPDVGGSLKVASFNVLNYFTTIDTGAPGGTGPAGDQNPRGADASPGTDPDGLTEFDRQQAKLVAALDELDADIVGLVELENDPAGSTSMIALVSALNAASDRTYGFVDTGPIEGLQGGALEGDAIKVGFIYDTDTVALNGDFAILDEGVDPRFQTVETQRPAVAQTFTEIASGASFTAAVNHFKSKGSVVNDEDAIGDGQGNNNPTRTLAAEALVDWLATDPTGSGDEDFMILGDLNAYLMEDPVQAVLAGADGVKGTADDFVSLVGPDDYSYGFPVNLDTVPQSQSFGTLDYALVSQSLFEQVTGSAAWHINADEAGVLDYNLNFKSTDQQLSLFAPDPFRASDHDPLLVGLSLEPEVILATARLEFIDRFFNDAVSYTLDGIFRGGAQVRALQDEIGLELAGIVVSADDGLQFSPDYVSASSNGLGVRSLFGDSFFGGDAKRIDDDETLIFELIELARSGDALTVGFEFGSVVGSGQAVLEFYADDALVESAALDVTDDSVFYDLAGNTSFDRVDLGVSGSLELTVLAAEFERMDLIAQDMV